MRLVETLAAAETPLGVGALGEAIGVDQPRASRLVQQAAERGLVEREADPHDARRTRIALTDRGRGFARGVHGERREALGTALQQFTDAERAELARLLDKLATHWPE
ncbi:MarR family winged helix-turn-helix transcriptional regulator [Leucobacter japonicus]|uniref:MarR family winged helix-turn-helix transcriptional regulator n=1 Tax=Leucobacter japonicus TaxID=1461259 RepID=UPI0006A76490|nr:MarR family transcriptional regulator [Leucobacter japonicus]